MVRYFEQELDPLNTKLLRMSTLVEPLFSGAGSFCLFVAKDQCTIVVATRTGRFG
jgi:hypothetical protein